MSKNTCFKLRFFTFYADKDECTSSNGGCEHICVNSYLSHACHCRGGYTLAGDSKNCNGI